MDYRYSDVLKEGQSVMTFFLDYEDILEDKSLHCSVYRR